MPGKFIPFPDSSVELGEGEILVRQYHITTNKRPKARGDVAVTNKRIVYQGKGKTSCTIKEVPIETVSAINSFQGSGFKAIMIILGILCIIIGIAFFATGIVPILGLILAIICFFKSFNVGYSLNIMSSAVSGTGISVGSSDITVDNNRRLLGRLFATSGQGAALSVKAHPTEEALQLMNELGAMVMDLKTMGDRAIPKWKNYTAQAVDTSALNATIRTAIDLNAIKESIPNVTITPRQPVDNGASPRVGNFQQVPSQSPQATGRNIPIQTSPAPARTAPPPPPPRPVSNPTPQQSTATQEEETVQQDEAQDDKDFFS